MDQFSIKDIENLSGIKAHTLRIWEQRYNLVIPRRKESNHRIYDNEDLKHILRIAYLYNNGTKISKIAGLNKEELRLAIPVMDKPAHFLSQLVEAALDFNEAKFEETLNGVISQLGMEQAIVKVIYPYLEKVGLLWLSDAGIPAQEHFASYLIQRKLIYGINKLPKVAPASAELILLYTPEGEMHEIPLLFMQYLLKKNNRATIYCGANVNLAALQDITGARAVTHIYLHGITGFVKPGVQQYINSICNRFKKMQVIVSGPISKEIASVPTNLALLTCLEDQINFAKKLALPR
ncbi:MerR family transcriptional regulator [Foetidibacter luteolus]|uniref:MerR family transcriptional regulator n=1 Tax=Foetidibacter luteolus TaxID=2608880 RepID=UPI00129AE73B|nr:MerR family transcriptional regulator [Foetidibacter luteolus]